MVKNLITKFVFLLITIQSRSSAQSLTRTFDTFNRLKEEVYTTYTIVYEYDRNDNLISKQIVWLGSADLVLVSASLSNTQVLPNASTQLNLDIKNLGVSQATASSLEVYLSTNNSYDASDVLLTSVAISVLPSQAQVAYNNHNITIPAGTQGGSYYLILKADAGNALNESNEGNNEYAIPIEVCYEVVSSASIVSTGYCEGDTTTIQAITNISGATYQWQSSYSDIPGETNPVYQTVFPEGAYAIRCIITMPTIGGCYSKLYDTTNHVGIIINQPADADFTYQVNGLTVNFSTPNSNSGFYWDFGDGQYDYGNYYPSHTYTQAGTYTVCQYSSNLCSSDQHCEVITVTNPCNPTLTLLGSQYCAGIRNFHLTGFPPAGSTVNWYRNNNLVGISYPGPNSPGAAHSNTFAGTYYAEVISPVCGTMLSNSITIVSTPPAIASFTSNASSNAVTFNNSSSNASSVLWDFGDGDTSSSYSPQHTYSYPDTYNVCLIAYNNCDNDSVCQSIVIGSCVTKDTSNLYSGLNTNPQVSKGGYVFKNGKHYLVWSNGTYHGNSLYSNHDAKVKLSISTDGVNWTTSDILTTSIGSAYHVIAIDNNDKLHVAYVEGTTAGYYGMQAGTLVYANNVNGSWVKHNTNLGTGNTYQYNWTLPHELLIGDDGILRMYYTTSGWWAWGGPLYMRALVNGVWTSPTAISTTNDGGADSQNNLFCFTKKENNQIKLYMSSGWKCTGVGCTPLFYNTIKEYTEGSNYSYSLTNTLPNLRWYYENTEGSNISVGNDGRSIYYNSSTTPLVTLPSNEKIYSSTWLSDRGNRVIANTDVKSNLYKTLSNQNLINGIGKYVLPASGFQIVLDNGSNPRRIYFLHDTTFNTCFSSMDVKLLIEGYYESNLQMKPVLFNQGVSLNSNITDTVTVELREPSQPYSVTHSFKGVINLDGSIKCTFPSSVISKQFYIAIKHRNSVETWSKEPITFNYSNVYNFTNRADKAFGLNQTELSTNIWALYSGDIDQNGFLELDDFNLWDAEYQQGYPYNVFEPDLDGNGYMELDDFNIWDKNYQGGIYKITP